VHAAGHRHFNNRHFNTWRSSSGGNAGKQRRSTARNMALIGRSRQTFDDK